MNNNLKNLLLAYINKSANADEIALAKNWIASSEENEAAYIKLYEDYHKALSAQHQFIDTSKAYQRFLNEHVVQPKAFYNNYLFRCAASLLVIMSLSFVLYRNYYSDKVSYVQTIETAIGKKNKIKLADGTLVYLNAGTTIKFDNSFNLTNRKVILDGEAYFDIAKSKKNIPFIVDAGGYIVKDIGTVFKIKSYSEDLDFEFSVLSGEISIESKKEDLKKIHLTKNQSVKIANSRSKDKLAKSIKNIDFKVENTVNKIPELDEGYNEWLSGTLSFDNTNFEEVTRKIEREFGVVIIIADNSLKNFHYSGAFKQVDNPYRLLDIIKQTTPITYRAHNKTIIINRTTNP